MKKIPTLFKRVYKNHKVVDIIDEITPGCEDAFYNGQATVKFDGSCCAIIEGVFYKRYDAKKGRKIPEGAIPCCDPDSTTGHWPHWVEVDPENPGDKWFVKAYNNSIDICSGDGTYEAVGPHFQGNPYCLIHDLLVKHGELLIDVNRSFEGIKTYLKENELEGIVFWLDDEPICKIKRSDFGFEWPIKKKGEQQ